MPLPFKLVYTDEYFLPLGAHVFPVEKYRLIKQKLVQDGVATPRDLLEPQPAADEDVLRVHTADYVRKLKTGTLSGMEQRLMEVPYSPQLVRAFWLAAGGCAVNIGGGFHHAYPDHGEGFCVLHDVAIAIRRLQHDAKIKTAMTVDCDVHHGNGTAAIFAKDESVFTISLHQLNNYPAYKPPSSLDVDLPDRTGDGEYLAALERALKTGFDHGKPDLLCYVAGADPYREDQLGGLALTIDGLKQRDTVVLQAAKSRGVPVMIIFAGGYARNVEDTVEIHCNTVKCAAEVF